MLEIYAHRFEILRKGTGFKFISKFVGHFVVIIFQLFGIFFVLTHKSGMKN